MDFFGQIYILGGFCLFVCLGFFGLNMFCTYFIEKLIQLLFGQLARFFLLGLWGFRYEWQWMDILHLSRKFYCFFLRDLPFLARRHDSNAKGHLSSFERKDNSIPQFKLNCFNEMCSFLNLNLFTLRIFMKSLSLFKLMN